jgi:hypothetical protein
MTDEASKASEKRGSVADPDWDDIPSKEKAYKRASVDDNGQIILDEQHEQYCRARANGFGKSQAFRAAKLHEGVAASSVSPMSCELEARPYISERIAQIKEENLMVAKSSESREEAVARWNDLFLWGRQLGGKEGIKLMVDAQKQIDKIMGFDSPDGKRPDTKERTFLDKDNWQEDAKKLTEMIAPKGVKDKADLN